MIQIQRSHERGHANHGWLEAYHTFSFANYYNPERMGFRALRVINEDRIQPAEGFGTHPHRDMEIITTILGGALEHKDSMGNGSVIHKDEVQYMSAGSGVTHSEFNASQTEVGHLLQIWILPEDKGLAPRYDQKKFSRDSKLNQLKLFCSHDGKDGSIAIRQDVKLYGSALEPQKSVTTSLDQKRYGYVQVASGELNLNGNKLEQGDGAFISETSELVFKNESQKECEFIYFDLN